MSRVSRDYVIGQTRRFFGLSARRPVGPSASRPVGPSASRPVAASREAEAARLDPRPQLICTPRPGTSTCNAFDLTTASVVQVPGGTIVSGWAGAPSGIFGGGATLQIRLPNGHFALAYARDFPRAPSDQVGQSDSRLVGPSAPRRFFGLSARQDAGPLATPPERRLGEGGALAMPDSPASSPPRLSPIEAAQRLEAALDRLGIPHGRVQVTHPRGVQIWSHPQSEYRPGTGIPLMDRVVVLPQGAILDVTPDPRILRAALETTEGFGRAFYSYHARWNLRDADQRFSPATFERLGVPTELLRGEGYIAGTMADRLLPLHRRGRAGPV